MNKAYLGLGTNMGNRVKYLRDACVMLSNHKNISIYTNQDDFLNICMEIDTNLEPEELLEVCHNIENQLKRVRTIRWGPRTIDVDILFFNNIASDDKALTLPHPRIKERAFVLIPLMDLNKELIIDDKNISYYLSKLNKEEIEEVKEINIAFSI